MKKTLLALAAVALAGRVWAGEHPQEHPTEHPAPAKTERPAPAAAKAEHPAHEHPVGSKAWVKQMNREYVRAVEDHIGRAGPALRVQDDKLRREWSLKLVRIHKNKIAYLGDDRFFACADFQSAAAGDKSQVDLDFYARKSAGAWAIERVLVHKVDGKPRFTYNVKNEMVPAP